MEEERKVPGLCYDRREVYSPPGRATPVGNCLLLPLATLVLEGGREAASSYQLPGGWTDGEAGRTLKWEAFFFFLFFSVHLFLLRQ